MPDRISKRMLEETERLLGTRDKDVLNAIRDFRYLTTDQIRRLYFADSASISAGLRATSRNLKKLKAVELVASLDRRIGGVHPGSGSYVWRLEPAGEHLLNLISGVIRPRYKTFRPSAYFLAHTLAVSECYVRITEMCGGRTLKLTAAQNEPDNWRPYNSKGKMVTLKPDLFVITVCEGYEDRWFFEIDLASESPVRIIEKCRRYFDYYRSGFEQKQCGVFPLVVWIVPDAQRKIHLNRHIHAEFAKLPNIFTVIVPEELETLIRQGAGDAEGGQE